MALQMTSNEVATPENLPSTAHLDLRFSRAAAGIVLNLKTMSEHLSRRHAWRMPASQPLAASVLRVSAHRLRESIYARPGEVVSQVRQRS